MATVTTQAELRSAIQNGTDPEILVANNITMTSYAAVNRSVTVRSVPGNPTATIFWVPPVTTSNPYLFRVNSGGNLTIDTLTMDGGGNDCGLVWIYGGTYVMNDGVTMTGVKSTRARSAVRIGDMTSTVGGTFIMNGGLITGVDAGPHTVVICYSGTITMSGDAAIENNPSAGLTVLYNFVDRKRSNVEITGNARIVNNSAGQTGGGAVFYATDAVIGEAETDAPVISGNYTPYYTGGILAAEGSVLTIGGRTEVSGNRALYACGGILVTSNSSLRVGGNVKVSDNRGGENCGGIGASVNSTVVLEGNAEISGNIAGDGTIPGAVGVGNGGGVMLQAGSTLEVKGTVSIQGNTADSGGGLYLMAPPTGSAYAAPTAVIGAEDSSPSIYENTAKNLGGGIFIQNPTEVTLAGQARIYENNAVQGHGVYNNGVLKVADSAEILDGLYFDCMPANALGSFLQGQTAGELRIESDDPDAPALQFSIPLQAAAGFGVQEADIILFADSPDDQQPLQCGKAPIIDETLTADAVLTIELSRHVTPQNVPLVIAYGDGDTIPLIDLDRAACQIPREFGPGYAVMLTPDRDQVIIDAIPYTIAYNDLHGVTNPNPASYKINGLPIAFSPPGERSGYRFTGWRDAAGDPVTEIPEGSTGDLVLTAVWQAEVYQIVYYDLFGTANPNPGSYSAEDLPIALAPPGARSGYTFLGWRDAAGNPATAIPEDTTGDLAYTAIWQINAYEIIYYSLFGASNPNPASYRIGDLPILFAVPGERLGYAFFGWQDAAGTPVTGIPEGTTGDLAFTAIWRARVYQITYRDLFGAASRNPASYKIEDLPVSLAVPGERPGYTFAGWRDAAGNPVTGIPVGSTGDLSFTALWQAEGYRIFYRDLFGSTHTNPTSYRREDLPIPLAPPSERPGYAFLGWRNAAGSMAMEIPEGSTGDLTYTAVWAQLLLSFDGNASCVCNMPDPIRADNGVAQIPCIRPCRPCHVFVCWNELDSGNGRSYCPGDNIPLSGGSMKLYAQWRFDGCCCQK